MRLKYGRVVRVTNEQRYSVPDWRSATENLQALVVVLDSGTSRNPWSDVNVNVNVNICNALEFPKEQKCGKLLYSQIIIAYGLAHMSATCHGERLAL